MVRDWNSLPDDHRNATTVDSFKCHLNHNKKVVPRHFYMGHRKLQVLHTRLRTKCSALNYDLFIRNIVTSPLCRCGEVENAEHYFLNCNSSRVYLCSFCRNQRAELIRTVSQFCRVTIECNVCCVETMIYHIKEMSVYSRLCKHTSKTVKNFKTGLLTL